MKITKRCIFTRTTNTLDLPITEEQYRRWKNGELIQNVMPHLSPDEREFLISGILPGTWNDVMGTEE